MIEIDGKQVFTELSELVDPAHAALLVVDMQRDFVAPGGAFDRLGGSAWAVAAPPRQDGREAPARAAGALTSCGGLATRSADR
jgi:hypothetical protein